MSRPLTAAEIITHAITAYVADCDLAQQYICDGCEWDSTPDDPDRCPAANHFDVLYQCPHADEFITFTRNIHDAVAQLLGPRSTQRYHV